MRRPGSTDLGDLSQMKPCMHIWTEGDDRRTSFQEITGCDDLEKAYLQPAKMLALTLIDLLYARCAGKRNQDTRRNMIQSIQKKNILHLLEDNSRVEIFDGTGV